MSTAPYCQPAVAACEALLTVPSKSHLLTHSYSRTHKEGNLTSVRLCFFSREALYVPLVFFSALL